MSDVDTACVKYMDQVLEAYAKWARASGVDQRPLAAGEVLHIAVELPLGYELPLSHEQCMLVDKRRALLPWRLNQLIEIEYLKSFGTDERNARRIGLKRTAYRARLLALQVRLFTLLQPEIDTWRQKGV